MSLEISFPNTSAEAKIVEDMLASGRFENEQAVMKQALSDLQRAEAQRTWLRQEIQKGLDSGIAPYEPLEERLSRLNKQYATRKSL